MAHNEQAHRTALLAAATRYLTAGISLVPINRTTKRPYTKLLPLLYHPDGSPVMETSEDGTSYHKRGWEPFQREHATLEQLDYWIRNGAQIAVVGGAISGNLLIIDFDKRGGRMLYDAWRERVGELADSLPMQRTGGGGVQVLVRCPEPGKNAKLAYLPDDTKVTGRGIAIETRGDGGYAVVAPSLHPEGTHYAVISGDLADIPTVSQAHADALLDAARALDEMPFTKQQQEQAANAPKKESTYRAGLNGDASVIDAFNARYDVASQLVDAGYVKRGGRYYLPGGGDMQRPGVVILDGVSYHHDSDDPLSDEYSHTAFDVYCHFQHTNNVKDAVHTAAIDLKIDYASNRPAPVADDAGYARCPLCSGDDTYLIPSQYGGVWHPECEKKYHWTEGLPKGMALHPKPRATDTLTRTDSTDISLEQSTDSEPPLFIVHPESDLEHIPPLEWLQEGEVIRRGYHLIYGGSGSGKTFYEIRRIMRSAAQGHRTLYIATEDIIGLKERVKAWRAAFPNQGGIPITWLEMPNGIDLQDEKQVDELVSALRPYGYEHISLDTLREAHSGDENSSQDGAKINRGVQRIIRETGAAVDVVHHSGVEDKRPRGTTAIFGNADIVLRVSKDEEYVSVSYDKVRNSAKPEPLKFAITSIDIGTPKPVGVLRTAETVTHRVTTLSSVHKAILEALSLSVFAQSGAKGRDLLAIVDGLTERTIFRALSVLKDKSYVSQGIKGDPYHITNSGRAQLAPELLTTTDTENNALESQLTRTDKPLTSTDTLPPDLSTDNCTDLTGSLDLSVSVQSVSDSDQNKNRKTKPNQKNISSDSDLATQAMNEASDGAYDEAERIAIQMRDESYRATIFTAIAELAYAAHHPQVNE